MGEEGLAAHVDHRIDAIDGTLGLVYAGQGQCSVRMIPRTKNFNIATRTSLVRVGIRVCGCSKVYGRHAV